RLINAHRFAHINEAGRPAALGGDAAVSQQRSSCRHGDAQRRATLDTQRRQGGSSRDQRNAQRFGCSFSLVKVSAGSQSGHIKKLGTHEVGLSFATFTLRCSVPFASFVQTQNSRAECGGSDSMGPERPHLWLET